MKEKESPLSGIRARIDTFFSLSPVRFMLWAGVALTPLFALLACETVSQKSIHALERINGGAVILALLICTFAFWGLTFILRRPWAASLLVCLPLWLMGSVNYFKNQLRGESLYPWELALAKSASDFSDFLPGLRPTFYMVFFLIAVLIWCALLFISRLKINLKWYFRIPLAFVLLGGIFWLLYSPAARADIYPRYFSITPAQAVQKQRENYQNNGFVAAFSVNLGNMYLSPPDGYSSGTGRRALEGYATPTDPAMRPDVVVVLSEAFWDPTLLSGTSFSRDPLERFNQIRQAHPDGMLVSPSFGGGTILPEFEVLTGATTDVMSPGSIPYLQYIHGDTWSFARYFKELNYRTLALHTYSSAFYGRSLAYPLLGFDELRGSDAFLTPFETSGVYASDAMMTDEIILELDNATEQSVFIFAITMENHGLYINKYKDEEYTIEVDNPAYSDEELAIVRNFAQGVTNADAALGRLYDYIQSRERPTALLFFGDHLPALSAGYSQYVKSGIIGSADANLWTREEIIAMHSCPYLILTNYDTGIDIEGGQNLSPFHLMNLLRRYSGLPSAPYFEFLMDYYKKAPLSCAQLSLVPADAKHFYLTHLTLSYDLIKGTAYYPPKG